MLEFLGTLDRRTASTGGRCLSQAVLRENDVAPYGVLDMRRERLCEQGVAGVEAFPLPIAMLLLPVVSLARAVKPTAVFWTPVVLFWSAWTPEAVFWKPIVLF
jgi:hypothetical protein